MATPPYPLHPEPMKKTWLDHNSLWKIPLGALVLVLLFGVFTTVVFGIMFVSFHSSVVYKQAVEKATHDPQVRDALGEPIQIGWLTSGNLSVDGDTGSANLVIPISGPRGAGKILAVAGKKTGLWRFTTLTVTIEGQQPVIDLLPPDPPPARDF